MSIGAGFSSKTAWRKEATQSAYRTVIACGANNQMPLIKENLTRTMKKELDHIAAHKNGHGDIDLVSTEISGLVSFALVYWGIESLLVSAMGFSHYSDSPELIDTGVYKYTLELSENLYAGEWLAGDGILAGSGYLAGDKKVRRGTLCLDKVVSIWEYASVMIQTMIIRGNSRGVQVDFELLPYNLDLASATNTSSSSWSIPNDDWESVLFQDLVLWIDDYSGSVALTSDDAIGISEFEIKLENNLAQVQDSLSGLYIAEPRRAEKRLVTGSFTMPRYKTDDLLSKLGDQSTLMAMLRFQGSEIGSTGYYHTFWIWLPSLKFDEVNAPMGGSGLIPVKHTFTAEIPAGAPAGFPTEATKEMVIQVQNNLNTKVLS
jgi:hypothetical protein